MTRGTRYQKEAPESAENGFPEQDMMVAPKEEAEPQPQEDGE